MGKMTEDFPFQRPAEAPTFSPTLKEFADPLAYISKIRPLAEGYGICKIKPPANWAPPFAVDVDKFKFTPRIQKINELEAITRIKLNFLDQISKFWELQGTSLRIPIFGHKALDLYTLHQLVHTNEFKTSKLSEDKKWNMIANRMGLQSNGKMSLGSQLKAHYDKILYPYDIWKSNQGKKKGDVTPTKKSPSKTKNGGRMGGPNKKPSDPLANYICQNCKGGDVEDKMLLCDGCDDSYHTFCLKPPLDEVPKGEWRCPDCLEEKLSRPNDGFGFEQATREYTLQQFGEMADTFKSDYFNMPVHMVSTEMVEREFWRIVSAIDEDVIVEYGADLHTMDHGSGFPTVSNSLADSDELYINSGWNLNKLPVLNGSVFAHINADISGMKIPWMYVGMCFSTFCWHNEDHWSYSINYLHWGEPKTWYGVPGGKADDFENAMKSAAPELFAAAPDLLHQLVTIMNPNILMKSNVPVYRMDQKAGEFIITFPRAYHAGFNQGYNFAEAVNFAPADWVQMGRECVMHYSKLNRFCVFSHDELVCAMAAEPDKLDYLIALATYKDMLKMFESEKEQRKAVSAWGVKQTERVEFEHLADDGRQCNVCKTTLFLSAVACLHAKGSSGKDTKLVCLKHYDQYGCKECKKNPEKHVMKYRYTLDELPEMIKGLRKRTESYEKWVKAVSDGLKSNEQSLSLEELSELVEEALAKDYPRTELLESAEKVRVEAEKTSRIAKALIGNPAVRTRKGYSSDLKFKCTITELKLLAEDMLFLRVSLPERNFIANLYKQAVECQRRASNMLQGGLGSLDEMANCLEECFILDVEFEEVLQLRNKYLREKWLRLANGDSDEGSVWTLDYLKKIIEDGNDVQRNEPAEKKMEELCVLYQKAFEWEHTANNIITSKEKFKISTVEAVISKASEIPVALPSLPQLREIVTKAKNWQEKATNFQDPKTTFLDDLITVVDIGEALPIELEYMKALQSQISAANVWRENCMKVFLKRNSTIDLIEALLPRKTISKVPQRGKKKRVSSEGPPLTFIANILGIPPPDVKSESCMTNAYWKCVATEVDAMKALRRSNREKAYNDENLFCVCQKPKDTFMIRCELCFEWFHPTCVPLPRVPNEDPYTEPDEYHSQAVTAHRIATRETKYIGPCCARSRRPEYRTILELLVGLKKLPLQLVEGVALQCLTDRAMKWQTECDKLLQDPDIKQAYEKVRGQSRLIATPATSPMKIDPEYKQAATGNGPGPDMPGPFNRLFFSPYIGEHSKIGIKVKTESENGSAIPETKTAELSVGSAKELEVALCLAGMQQGTVNPPQLSPQVRVEENDRPHKRKFEPLITLEVTPEKHQEIENLLIEADLMEVTAEESEILWKLYDLIDNTQKETRDLAEVKELIDEEIARKGLVSYEQKQERLHEIEMIRKRRRSLSGGNENLLLMKRILPVSPIKKRKPSGGDSQTKRMRKVNQECDEDCAASEGCKQPTGKEVNWIQCDACDQWFHLTCVGLKKSQVKNLDNYTCGTCEDKKAALRDEDGSSCDTDSKLSSSGKLSISSNKENKHRGGIEHMDLTTVIKEEPHCSTENSTNSNSHNIFSKVN